MGNSRWAEYWSSFPSRFPPGDFLRQVGKTVNQAPVEEAQIAHIASAIAGALELGPADFALDLCCGNGLITARLAQHCDRVLGIDFSAPLIAVAERYHRPPNVAYACHSVLDITQLPAAAAAGKAWMYEALQHFEFAEVRRLLAAIAGMAGVTGTRLFLGSIPDHERLDRFYDTPGRREEYARRSREGTEAIGTWWRTTDLMTLAEDQGFECLILPQDTRLYTAHYRFDALLTLPARRADV